MIMNDIIYFTFHFSDLEYALVILCVAFYLLEKKKKNDLLDAYLQMPSWRIKECKLTGFNILKNPTCTLNREMESLHFKSV